MPPVPYEPFWGTSGCRLTLLALPEVKQQPEDEDEEEKQDGRRSAAACFAIARFVNGLSG